MLVTDLLLNAPSISNVPNVREEDVAGVVGGVQLVTWPEGGVMNMKLRVKRLKKDQDWDGNITIGNVAKVEECRKAVGREASC